MKINWSVSVASSKLAQALAVIYTIGLLGVFCSTQAQVGNAEVQRCAANPDPRYVREEVLEELNSILKSSIPAYGKYPGRGFFVYDLSEPENRYVPAAWKKANACINFVNNHIYHFAPIEFDFTESHIAVLEDGKLKLFKAINCMKSKDRLEDVIAYVEQRFASDPKKDELIARIRDYKKHSVYFNIDSTRPQCEFPE